MGKAGESRRMVISVLMLIVGMISIQTGASLAKTMFAAVGPQGAAALRLAFASLILMAVWRPWRGGLTPAQGRAVLLYGLTLGAMNLLFYLALNTLPLGVAVALEFTGPLAVATAGSRRWTDLVWVALAVLGLLLLLLMSGGGPPIDLRGAAYALGAGACWAGYIVFGQKAGEALHSGRAAALGMAVAALLVIPFGVIHAGMKLWTPSLLPFAIGVAVLSSALPYTLEMIALKRLPVRTFGVLMSLEPAVAALLGLTLLGEHLVFRQWLGVGCVMTASLGAAATAQAQSMVAPSPE